MSTTAYVRISNGNIVGTGFFASSEYIITCCHVVEGLDIGMSATYRFDTQNRDFNAEIIDFDEEHDLALLKAEEENAEYYRLDRVPVKGTATVYGYPNSSSKMRVAEVRISEINGDGFITLEDANSATTGDSGAPLCVGDKEKTVVGVFNMAKNPDTISRGLNVGFAVPASVILDKWSDFVCEKRYEVKKNNKNTFVYNAFKTDFIGRKDELAQLQRFADDRRSVLWQVIAAQGGSGKSRLAYEFAHSLNSEWHCEIVKQGALTCNNLDKIYDNAQRNLFIIADYAYTNTNELGKWLSEKEEKLGTGDPKIRVLLLQRASEGENNKAPWFESLTYGNNNITALRYSEDIHLEKPEKEDVISVMCSYAERTYERSLSDEKCAELYSFLERVDEGLTRPLFAMFIADAFLSGDEPLEWDNESALDYFSNRELSIIQNEIGEDKNCASVCRLIWVLATITDGFEFTEGSFPKLEEYEISKENLKLLKGKRLVAFKNHKYVAEALKPDILGEYFVKKFLSESFDSISDILCAACAYAEEKTRDFITRMFADISTDFDFAEACCGEDMGFENDVLWGFVIQSDAEMLREFYDYKPTPYRALMYARGLVNYIGKQTDPAKADEALGRLEALYEENKDNDEVEAVFNLAHILIAPDKESAYQLLLRLKTLAENNPVLEEYFDLGQRIYNARFGS